MWHRLLQRSAIANGAGASRDHMVLSRRMWKRGYPMRLRAVLTGRAAASAWNGMLVARNASDPRLHRVPAAIAALHVLRRRPSVAAGVAMLMQ